MILASTAITVSWPTLAAIAAVMLALVKFGDRLWGRVRNGGGGPSTETRLARLEDHACHSRKELSEIKGELKRMNDRLFRILERRG